MKMQLIDIIDILIPGDTELGLPCFSYIAESQFNKNTDLIDSVNLILIKFQDTHTPNLDASYVTKTFVSFFMNENAEVFKEFKLLILDLYFKSETVLDKLGYDVKPLFPTGQLLPDNNFDLLVDVYHRGKIWREID